MLPISHQSSNAVAASSSSVEFFEESDQNQGSGSSSYPKMIKKVTAHSEYFEPSYDREDITFDIVSGYTITASFISSEEAAKWRNFVKDTYPFSQYNLELSEGERDIIITKKPRRGKASGNILGLVFKSGIRIGKNKKYPRFAPVHKSMKEHFEQAKCIGGTGKVRFGTLAPEEGRFVYQDEHIIHAYFPTREQAAEWWAAVGHIPPFTRCAFTQYDGKCTYELRAIFNEKYEKPMNIAEVLKKARLPIEKLPPRDFERYLKEHPEASYKVGVHTYQLMGGVLGEGCFGKVRLGKDVKSNEHVAIKILNQPDDREDQVLKQVKDAGGHPNIVRYIDSGKVFGKTWIAMEYLEGMTAGVFAKEYRWTAEMRSQYEDAIGFLAEKGIPPYRENPRENIMVIRNNGKWQVKLIDFGTLVKS